MLGVVHDPLRKKHEGSPMTPKRRQCMSGKRKNRLLSSYLSQEVYDIMNFLVEREEMKKVVFVKRAIRDFMQGELITARTDPMYIERNKMVTVELDEEQREQLLVVARENGCNQSQVFFQCILNYCLKLIAEDPTGLTIE